MTVASFGWQRSSVTEAAPLICQVPDTSRKKEKNHDLCRLLDRTRLPNLKGLRSVLRRRCSYQLGSNPMIRKMRTFVAALLLIPALTLNANAFTVDTDGVSASQQVTGYCWIYYMGRWIMIPC
jgi:hypothetical protein